MRIFSGNKTVGLLAVLLLGVLFAVPSIAQVANPVVPGMQGGYDPYGNFYPSAGKQYFLTSSWSQLNTCFQASPPAVTISIASPAVVSLSNSCVAGQAIQFQTSGALPTGLTAGTTYYIIAAGLTGSSFEVSASLGGAAVNTSGTQSGFQTAYAVYQNATTGYLPAIVMAPVPPGMTAVGHCTLFWQTTNTTGTLTLGALLNNTTSTLYVLNTAHTGANGATLADVSTTITTAATPTAISGAMTAGTANTSYRDDINFNLTTTGTVALPTILTFEGLSSSASYTVSLQPGSYCSWGS